MHFPYKKTERGLKAYHGNEQEKPVGELESTEQVGGRRRAPSDEQSRSGGHQGNRCWLCWEMGLAMRNCQGKWQLAQPSVCLIEIEKI